MIRGRVFAFHLLEEMENVIHLFEHAAQITADPFDLFDDVLQRSVFRRGVAFGRMSFTGSRAILRALTAFFRSASAESPAPTPPAASASATSSWAGIALATRSFRRRFGLLTCFFT